MCESLSIISELRRRCGIRRDFHRHWASPPARCVPRLSGRLLRCVFFFFQAEDGIRDGTVTGVQTCALPILWFDTQGEEAANFYVSIFKNSRILGVSRYGDSGPRPAGTVMTVSFELNGHEFVEIGRASCRERVESGDVGGD